MGFLRVTGNYPGNCKSNIIISRISSGAHCLILLSGWWALLDATRNPQRIGLRIETQKPRGSNSQAKKQDHFL